jgi:DNA-binding transcriptional MerR regulator
MTTIPAPAPLLTHQVARLLGVSESRLRALIKSGRIAEPQRVGGRYHVWSTADLEAARLALKDNASSKQEQR